MEAIEAILTRRSIRHFTSQVIPNTIIQELLNAAMHAPSAGNEQPWHFIVIRDRKILDEIPRFHPFSKMLSEVSVAILVCGDVSQERYRGFWVQDCSAATQNILIAARAKGLGSVWLGFYPHMDRVKNLSDLLRLPENIIPLSLIPIGYPAEEISMVKRFNEKRIHYDKW
jgi:nitroreductase